MKVYVAASWNDREHVKAVTEKLRACGFECTNGWMDREAITSQECANCAIADLAEVQAADAVVLLNYTKSTGGGMHFETGYAHKAGKRVFVIGQLTGVFHHLPGVSFFSTLERFIEFETREVTV